MTRAEHILTTLGEEGNEVAQRISKAMRFGFEESQPGQHYNNVERIANELDDLLAMAAMAAEEGILRKPDPVRMNAKRAAFEAWLLYAKAQGRVDE